MRPIARRSYRQLMWFLSEQLGSIYLPIDQKASSAALVVLNETAYYPLMREMSLGIYKENALRNMQDSVSLYACLDAVGRLRGSRIASRADIDEIRLLDRVGELLVDYFSDERPRHSQQSSSDRRQSVARRKLSGQADNVISLR